MGKRVNEEEEEVGEGKKVVVEVRKVQKGKGREG